jgi:ETC complex I subunit conserved region
MGWTSSADPLDNVGRASLFFYTQSQAEAYCKKHGWEFSVSEPHEKRTARQKRFNAYGDNYRSVTGNAVGGWMPINVSFHFAVVHNCDCGCAGNLNPMLYP